MPELDLSIFNHLVVDGTPLTTWEAKETVKYRLYIIEKMYQNGDASKEIPNDILQFRKQAEEMFDIN